MDRAIAARIQEWDTRPLTAGYRGLQELSDANFSGAVTTGTAWLFILNGRVVGVVDGTMASFESAEATAHEAPDPALPLLYAMQERGGETRAKYYTDDNPLPEVHETLTEAGFTGYIELSENILSGDYYVVYYGGKSMSAAFVGNTERLVTGDEAFHQAADEVGIYEVRNVELDVRNVPEPDDGDGTDDATGAVVGTPDEPDDDPAEALTDPTFDEAGGPSEDPPASEEPADATSASGSVPGATPEPAEPAGAPSTDATDDPPTETAAGRDPAAEGTGEPEPAAEPEGDPDRAAEGPATTPAGADQEDPFSQEAAWRETRTIPALDPEESDTPGPTHTEPAAEPRETPARTPSDAEGAEPSARPDRAAAAEPRAEDPPAANDQLEELRAALEEQSATIEELQAELESSRGDAESLREEREQLEAELEAARHAEASDAPGADARALERETALDQTDLFVRYGTKGGGTLEKAHDGVIDREEVVENLRIEHHTRFEADEVSVEGRRFETFLESTVEYQFVDWLVTHLLFEIQDTGSQRGLRDLFDAIPLVDRAEFQGTIEMRDEEGEVTRESFDVVCRDRMGQPLVVANLNDVRDPATGEMMTGLIDGASAVAAAHETLGGAFMVTASFFQPDALETAAEATGGGLLAREKRWSYVKLGRRQGFHLCLVEARGDNFHVAVPEL